MHIRLEHFTADVIDGKIYVIGWHDYYNNISINITEVYNLFMNSWSILNSLDTPSHRFVHATTVIENSIYVFGGFHDLRDTNEVLILGKSSVEEYFGSIFYNHRIYPIPATTTLNIVSVEAATPYK